MFNKVKFFATVNLLWLLIACGSTNSEPLSIQFSSDSSKIVIKNINDAGLYQLKTNLATDSAYQKVVSVLQTPSDDDSLSMEIAYPGDLTIIGDSLIYTPKNEFVKGKVYLVETMINTQFAKSEEIIKSQVGRQIKAQQKILKR
jgi:hypothetical protein